MNRRIAAAAVLLLTVGCHRDTDIGGGGGHRSPDLAAVPDLAPVPDLATVDGSAMSCRDKNPNLARCNTDGGCDSFQKCVLGVCCGGELDPVSCVCRCAGRECVPWTPGLRGEACCTGLEGGKRCKLPVPPNPGVLMCRPREDCEPEGGCE